MIAALLQLAAAGAVAVGAVLSAGVVIESQALSYGIRRCFERNTSAEAVLCAPLLRYVGAQERAAGVVLLGAVASGCSVAAAVAGARRRG